MKKSPPVTARGPFDDDERFEGEVIGARKVRALLRQCAEHRERIDMSQTAVARRMGTTQSAISDLESHQVSPRVTTLIRYVAALGGSLTFDPGFDADQPAISDDEASMSPPEVATSAPVLQSSPTLPKRATRKHGIGRKWAIDSFLDETPPSVGYAVVLSELDVIRGLERVDIDATALRAPQHPLYVSTVRLDEM